jgi:hypothetical protein
MKDRDDLVGKLAYLPDGQKVRIELTIDGRATVRRVGGVRDRSLAVCAIDRLKITRS